MTPFTGLAWLNALFFLGSLSLGAVVSLQAYRSYRRTDDPTMGYFAVGLFLVLVASTLVDAVGTFFRDALASIGLVPVMLASVFEGFVGFAGVCAIAYGLYAKRRV